MEYKFRGKRKDNEEWIYGDLCTGWDGNKYIMPKAYFASRIESNDEHLLEPHSMAWGGFFEVIPETVGMYIGKKDESDKDIYAGDYFTQENDGQDDVLICRYNEEQAKFIWDLYGLKMWHNEGGGEEYSKGLEYIGPCDIDDFESVKIEGNKWDNPELLTK